jgi:protein-disulfide isomerase
MITRHLAPAAALIADAALTAFALQLDPQPAGAQSMPSGLRAPSPSDHIMGSPDASVFLIEYSDFQCPYCSTVHRTLHSVVSASKGTAWVYRHFPLRMHPQAGPAANAAECIAEQRGNDGFWKFADALYADRHIGPTTYSRLAAQIGVNASQFSACVSAAKHQGRIDADQKEANRNGGSGTPFTIVYGHGRQIKVEGAESREGFLEAIRSAGLEPPKRGPVEAAKPVPAEEATPPRPAPRIRDLFSPKSLE